MFRDPTDQTFQRCWGVRMRNTEGSGSFGFQRHSCHRYGFVIIVTPKRGRLTFADTIDVSNLNRQFLFREADVGKPKAEVAAAFVKRRVKGVKITPYYGKIQDKDEAYYKQFNVVVCGLDSIEARRWINATLVDMFDANDMDSLKPLIDGGTEGRFRCTSRSGGADTVCQGSKANHESYCPPWAPATNVSSTCMRLEPLFLSVH